MHAAWVSALGWLARRPNLGAALSVAVVLILLAALSTAGLQTLRLGAERTAHAAARAAHAFELARAHAAVQQAETDARAEERRRYNALQEIHDGTLAQLDAARTDAAAAADAGHRLRQQLAAARAASAARCGAADTAPPAGGAPARAAPDLLDVVQQRLDEAAEQLAEFADRAHAAGLGCQRSYEALRGE